MPLVRFANGRRSRIGVEVILLLPQRESALMHKQDIHLGVLLVGIKTGIHKARDTVGGIFQSQCFKIGHAFSTLKRMNERHYRRHALAIESVGIHRQFIEIAQLPLDRTLGVRAFHQLSKDSIDTFVVVLSQTIETTET